MKVVSDGKINSLPLLSQLVSGVLVLGSIWGLSEVVLGGVLRVAEFPYRAGLLTGVGMAIMGAALAVRKNPAILIGVGLVAVSVKLLAVPILHISVMCKANSCLAVFIEAVALSLVAFWLSDWISKSVHARIAAGSLAALIASVGFYCVGRQVAPCEYLLSFTPQGFVVTEGLIWAAFSGILLPVGYLAGEKLTIKAPFPLMRRPVFYFVSTLVVSVCLGGSALAIKAGL